MIALDPNVLVRLFVRDDPDQFAAAHALVGDLSADAPGFLAREVLIELVWVLGRAYRYGRDDIAGLLAEILNLENLTVEAEDDVARVLEGYRAGLADFAT